jgi:hypothetical protein
MFPTWAEPEVGVVAEEERKMGESGTGVAETVGRWHLALEPLGV